MNAENARPWKSVSKREVQATLRHISADVAAWVCGLSDEQLERRGEYIVGYAIRTVDQLIERTLIGHIRGHLSEMHAALSGPESATT